MLFEEAEGSVPGEVLGEVDEEHVEEGYADEADSAGVAEDPVSGCGVVEGAADGPAGEEARGEDEEDEEESGEPGEFAWGEFDLEQVEGQGEEESDEEGEPEGEGSALEEAPYGERVEKD